MTAVCFKCILGAIYIGLCKNPHDKNYPVKLDFLLFGDKVLQRQKSLQYEMIPEQRSSVLLHKYLLDMILHCSYPPHSPYRCHRNCYQCPYKLVYALWRRRHMILSSPPRWPNRSNLLLSSRSKRLDCKLPCHVRIHHTSQEYLRSNRVPLHGDHRNMIYRSLTIVPILAIHQGRVEISDDCRISLHRIEDHCQRLMDHRSHNEKM